MIPSTSFQMNDDGTAWWVTDDPVTAELWRAILNRPCDICGGGRFTALGKLYGQPCQHCDGTGRHTFTVEVEWPDALHSGESDTLRVHVLEVLPIWAEGEDGYQVLDAITVVDAGMVSINYHRIPFPSSAKPGMWAVLLAVH
jgi:hypothetical protein